MYQMMFVLIHLKLIYKAAYIITLDRAIIDLSKKLKLSVLVTFIIIMIIINMLVHKYQLKNKFRRNKLILVDANNKSRIRSLTKDIITSLSPQYLSLSIQKADAF